MKKLLFFTAITLMLTFFYQTLTGQSGNVGVGTTNPQAKLHVAGDARIDSKLEIKNSSEATIFRLDPDNNSFELLNSDGSVIYQIAIGEATNFNGNNESAEKGSIPPLPFTGFMTDPIEGTVQNITTTVENGVVTTKKVVTEPNGITTTTIATDITEPIIEIKVDPTTNSKTETYFEVLSEFSFKSIERFTDATGVTISVFENGVLKSRKVFNKDGDKVVDFDGNTNTATPIGMETVSADGDELFSDIFGTSIFDSNGNFTGLAFDPINGLTSEGDFDVLGFLSKSGGTFKIDHPLDPTNKWLYHSFVESPDMMNIYNGNITTNANGNATVELPEYFGVLNSDFRYQLTPIGAFAQAIISKKVENNQFEIKTSEPNIEVSWQVTGIRQDDIAKDHRVEVEVEKTGWEKGKRRYDPNRKNPYSERLQNHWDKHVAKRK